MLRLPVNQGEASMARSVRSDANIAVMSLLYYSDGQSAVYYPLPTSPKSHKKNDVLVRAVQAVHGRDGSNGLG